MSLFICARLGDFGRDGGYVNNQFTARKNRQHYYSVPGHIQHSMSSSSGIVSGDGSESAQIPIVPIVRHPDFYFSDGSVVMILEGTALRIHQSVLARHSEVFNGMWDVPQPSSSEKYDGCPCVHMSDSLGDFVEVAKVLYDPLYVSSHSLKHGLHLKVAALQSL
jgi:hypothetical protein